MSGEGRLAPEERPIGIREFEVLGYAFLCVDEEFPAVDCRLLAGLTGLQSAYEAVNEWGAFKRKVKGFRTRPKLSDITFRELQIAGYAWQCIPTDKIPEVKPKRLVKLGLYETREKATKAWNIIKKKLISLAENDENEPDSATPAAPALSVGPVARSTPNKRNAGQEGDGETEGSAPKRRRRAGYGGDSGE
ncbi:hypothetical protein PG993_001181 [Apiospora rasikravindrae]|uniref:Uncharacterized protein n=1 Tax=Apiospora rasikravindrae TaxID=990691 RepID=A0ABR1UDI7_9PEZI